MTAQNETRFIPLSALRDGHEYPGAAINARLTGQVDGLTQLAASIRKKACCNHFWYAQPRRR